MEMKFSINIFQGAKKDIYGNEIFRCTAPFDGVVLYYTLSLGVKCKDPLIAFGEI